MAPLIGDVMKRLNRLGAALLATAFSGCRSAVLRPAVDFADENRDIRSLWWMTSVIGMLAPIIGGMMGYRTPNIDRIANEGAIFTDYYGQTYCGARGVHHRPKPNAHWVAKSRASRSERRLVEKDPTLADLEQNC